MSKLATSDQATFCATAADEWARAGVRHAVVCPGSRSTPMALALRAEERIEVHVRLDERSACFTALGIGLGSGVPAILVTTSGTAAAEAHPGVVEAHQARVPLIVCTADRPFELHGVAAPQTVVQQGIYGSAVRFAADPGVPEAGTSASWRSLAARLFSEATASCSGPGPVHLNVAFREPLDGLPGELPAGRPGGRPWHTVLVAGASGSSGLEDRLGEVIGGATRPLLVVGGRAGAAPAALEAAAELGWPVLADPRSGWRDLSLHEAAGGKMPVVATADSLLRSASFGPSHRPDLVVRLGEAWASKVLAAFLHENAAEGSVHLLADPFGEWRDPGREVGTVLRADPEAVLRSLAQHSKGAAGPGGDPSWASSWASAEQVAQEAMEAELGRLRAGRPDELTEPQVARALTASGAGTIVVSSSMPVRDLEWFSRPRPGYPTVLANRGANGIDGVVSTAIGVAEAASERARPVVALVGDLAFLHDLTALVRSTGASAPALGLVVVDNGGGGIFSYLRQAESLPPARFEELFATPQEADLAGLARSLGWPVEEVSSPDALDEALGPFLAELAAGRRAVLVCHVAGRQRNVEVHDGLNEAVDKALRAWGST